MRGVAILGSTGSIGTTALKVLARQRDRFRVVALTAGTNGARLAQQVADWEPTYSGLAAGAGGPDCLIEAATHPEAEIVLNGVVGAAGLRATVAALRAGKRVALANKEALVMAGDLIMRAAAEGQGEIVPVDSEHSAILQCLTGGNGRIVALTLTASGGPFRDWPVERVNTATVADALQHPTWRMGRKITVDSATLANKALEVIEARYLFDLDYDRIHVVVHPQSIVHGFVEYVDGSVLAQVGWPSMELPILYALTHPERVPDAMVPRFDPSLCPNLTFEPVRDDVFRAFRLGVEAGRAGGGAPAAFNAANEIAVDAFLDQRICFGRIPDVIEHTLSALVPSEVSTLDEVVAVDRWARARARGVV